MSIVCMSTDGIKNIPMLLSLCLRYLCYTDPSKYFAILDCAIVLCDSNCIRGEKIIFYFYYLIKVGAVEADLPDREIKHVNL